MCGNYFQNKYEIKGNIRQAQSFKRFQLGLNQYLPDCCFINR